MEPHNFRILLINPPHTAIGSRIPKEKLPPLGLLSIGWPLLDAGYRVRLLNGEFGPMSVDEMVMDVVAYAPRIVMIGHSGSSSAHAGIIELTTAIKSNIPNTIVIYGGVFPTYHWEDILNQVPSIDLIVRGEGEKTTVRLVNALYHGKPIAGITGIAYRIHQMPHANPDATLIENLDLYRIGWELIDHSQYSYWGNKRAVVVQFSRGCPYPCSYCGQRGFWTQWRHRDPIQFAKELARMYREHGIEVINFADELPTGSRKAWKAFLEALIAENVPLVLVGSTRAGDIVRDADILHLYRKAGVIRFLLGIESYDEKTLKNIKKHASPKEDQFAIKLLRQHGIISMATYVVGFEEETDKDYWNSLRHLLAYDPDQIQLLYVTPHRWTPFYASVTHRKIIQTDSRKWDYKHQVLATAKIPPWRVFIWVKAIESILQLRPRALFRLFFHPDHAFRHAMRWYYKMGRKVWIHEVIDFITTPLLKGRLTLGEFMGQPLCAIENAMAKPLRRVISVIPLAKNQPLGEKSVLSASEPSQKPDLLTMP